MNKTILYLLTIIESIEKINIYSSECENADHFFSANDQKEFNATLNLLIAIGEEAKKIDPILTRNFPEIDWKSVIALRNELSHNYRGVDPDIIWDIIQTHLDGLRDVCIKIILQLSSKEDITMITNADYYKHARKYFQL